MSVAFDTVRTRRGGRSARVRAATLQAAREELMDAGYARLSHLAVARRAEVDPATVYRRWPSRARLAIDAVVDLAQTAVPLPDTGSLHGDLTQLHRTVAALLKDPSQLRLFQAFSFAALEDDPEVASALQRFWRGRFAAAGGIFDRAAERGEIRLVSDAPGLIEQLVGPLYLRALVTRGPLDRKLTEQSVKRTMVLAGAAGGE